MLTADLVRPRLRKRGKSISIKMLGLEAWRDTAQDLLDICQAQVGLTAGEWENALTDYEGERLDYVVIRGLAKVLSDAAIFEPLDTPYSPSTIREAVFSYGPIFSQADLFNPNTRDSVFAAVAQELDIAPEAIAPALFADRQSAYVMLETGQDWTPDQFINRYNLELARGVLYWATEMRIELLHTDKNFWRYLKLFKLMFWATANPRGGYDVVLDGPISEFVKSTTRYGRQFAAFLPALFLCEAWQMQADVRPDRRHGSSYLYHLNDQTPLTSHFKRSPAFDSRLEADFAAEFAAKFGDERGKWILTREDDVLLLGDTVMLPDFTLTHREDGRRALIEIIGFWHPDYLKRKLSKIRSAQQTNLILLVYEGVNLTADRLVDVPNEVLYFKNKPVLKDVMAAVERVAE